MDGESVNQKVDTLPVHLLTFLFNFVNINHVKYLSLPSDIYIVDGITFQWSWTIISNTIRTNQARMQNKKPYTGFGKD